MTPPESSLVFGRRYSALSPLVLIRITSIWAEILCSPFTYSRKLKRYSTLSCRSLRYLRLPQFESWREFFAAKLHQAVGRRSSLFSLLVRAHLFSASMVLAETF